MKLKLLLAMVGLSLAFTAEARVQFQAGDIAEGQKWVISDTTGVASYYKTGKSGNVKFTCEFEGEGVKALVYAGKNFIGNQPEYMQNGFNGPYSWKLRDEKANEGSIRVQLIRGDNVTVQCKEVA